MRIRIHNTGKNVTNSLFPNSKLEIIISLLLFVNVCERSEFVPVTGRLSAGMTKQIRLEALAQTLQPLLNTARQKSIKIQLRLKRKKELRE